MQRTSLTILSFPCLFFFWSCSLSVLSSLTFTAKGHIRLFTSQTQLTQWRLLLTQPPITERHLSPDVSIYAIGWRHHHSVSLFTRRALLPHENPKPLIRHTWHIRNPCVLHAIGSAWVFPVKGLESSCHGSFKLRSMCETKQQTTRIFFFYLRNNNI